jgi:flagellar basal body-associated protein FliL
MWLLCWRIWRDVQPDPQAQQEAVMKNRRRWIGLIVLMAALVAILAVGFYRSVTGQNTHPQDSSAPAQPPAAT